MASCRVPIYPTVMATGRSRDDIYVATTPLRAAKGPAQLMMSAAYSLNLWDLHHFMLIIKPSTTSTSMAPLSNSQATVFDFQPQDPENIYVALAALSGRPIPGTILVRKISKLPKKKCWYIGSSKLSNAIEAAYEFNSSWETDLCIGLHDCRHYTNGLAQMLTGKENVLEHLRRESTANVY
ncbi:Adhesion G protein-coupled receptor L3 [Bienertia sinuspersici]